MVTEPESKTDGQTSDLAKSEETKITLPCLQPFLLNTPDGDISESGQEDIQWELRQWGYPTLPEDFLWVWATNRGTLPKRVQSHYFKEHKIKVAPEHVSALGNLARRHASVAQTVVLDFTEKLNWHDGDFGDGGSCFWGDKSGAREMIEEHGYAVRAYKERSGFTLDLGNPQTYRGYARAWVSEIGDNRLIVFNGYGESTLTFARWLALKFNCSYKRISLTNQGLDDGVLWINGGTGYVVGQHIKIEKVSSHDFGWREVHDSRYTCEECEERLNDDEILTAWDRHGHRYTVCEDCCSCCDNCRENFTYALQPVEECGQYCNDCRESKLNRLLSNAREELEKLEERVRELEDKFDEIESDLEEAKTERGEAQERVEALESEVD